MYADSAPERAVSAVAWHRDNSGDRTKPVGTRTPNALGIFDLYGNVNSTHVNACLTPPGARKASGCNCWHSMNSHA